MTIVPFVLYILCVAVQSILMVSGGYGISDWEYWMSLACVLVAYGCGGM